MFDKINTNDTTTKYQEHIPNSCGLKYNCIYNEHSEPIKNFNNADQNLLLKDTIEELEKLAKKSYRLIQQNKDNKILTSRQQVLHFDVKSCNNCQCGISGKNKVIHHNHITGKYISTICNDCNLQFKYKSFIAVYIHNLKSYDAHCLILALITKYGYISTRRKYRKCFMYSKQ
jgi:hypothetical protein